VTPRGTYTEWWWPPSPTIARTLPRGYGDFEHVLVPEIDPGPGSTYYWAHQFGLVGGRGGYLGLQTDGHRFDGSVGKMAIFSIWDALSAEGVASGRFGGEGEGLSCRVPYLWEAGHGYRLRVWTVEPGWWAASVTDEETGIETEIGFIRVPGDWRQLDTWSVMWTEYYGGPLASCADLPHSKVIFSVPTADRGSVQPDRSVHRLGEGTCDGSATEPVRGGVRHEMGR